MSTYHVVCHDCTAECLKDRELAAEIAAKAHRFDFGHDAEYAQVD